MLTRQVKKAGNEAGRKCSHGKLKRQGTKQGGSAHVEMQDARVGNQKGAGGSAWQAKAAGNEAVRKCPSC